MITTGLDRLLAEPECIAGRRYGLLCHQASVTRNLVPAHVALAGLSSPPVRLFGPEHGLYGVEQDMVPSDDQVDRWTGLPIVSLYGSSVESLRPDPVAFESLDLLVIDLQDIGSRYYTFAATAVWAAEVALDSGCEVWLLDRPNPLGGVAIEGNVRQDGFESFVGAFRMPVRHGLTLGEVLLLEALRRGWPDDRVRVFRLGGWTRKMSWRDTQRPWIAPSPNIPTSEAALVYPGGCLVEATELSEGRGTTRPFQILGAPHLDPLTLQQGLAARGIAGVAFLPIFFRPQFHKHSGSVCGGVEVVVTDADSFRPYRFGVEFLDVVHDLSPGAFRWRAQPYEFVSDVPVIDLLTGSAHLRHALETGAGLASWLETWPEDESEFRRERREILLYEG